MLEAILLKMAVTLVTAGATYITHRVGSFFKAKTTNEKIWNAINVVDKIVVDSVKVTEQTMKKQIIRASGDGKITKDEAKQLLSSTAESVMKELPKDIEKQIAKMAPDINSYVSNKIEAAIHDIKLKN